MLNKIFIKRSTTINLKKEIKELAKSTGVKKVMYNNRGFIDGSYNSITTVIFINSKLNRRHKLQTFFHELAHHVACKRGWWREHHFEKVTDSSKAFMYENMVDRLARRLWRKYVDIRVWGRYKFSYPISEKRKQIKFLDLYYGI